MAPRALTVYRLLLRLFPAPFRDRFGRDMADVFADRLQAAHRRGHLAVMVLWGRTTIDVISHASAERRRAPRIRERLRGFMRALLDDLATAVRGHLRRPGLLLLAAPMLAVGIGFNSALFAVVHEVILRPLPYVAPDRVMFLWTGRNGVTQLIGLSQGLFDVRDTPASETHPATSAAARMVMVWRSPASERMLDRAGRPVQDQGVSMKLTDLKAQVARALAGAH